MAKKKNELVVGFCLDESGSMAAVLHETISGFNEYVDGLRSQKGKTSLSLTMFSSDRWSPGSPTGFEPVHRAFCQNTDIADVARLNVENYRPDGYTPLYDAVGHTIQRLSEQLAPRGYDGPVLFVIQTDGQENRSREFTGESVEQLIRSKEAAGWRFVYLGANMDEVTAQRSAAFMGVAAGQSVAYDYATTDKAFRGVTRASSGLRTNSAMSAVNVASTIRDTIHEDDEEEGEDGGTSG